MCLCDKRSGDMNFYNPSPRLFFARQLAFYLHRMQAYPPLYSYPGGYYDGHISKVELLLWDWSCRDEDILIASLLHDSKEDTFISYETIEFLFGVRVKNLVCVLTRDKSLQTYVYYIRFIKVSGDDATLIKVADLTVNLEYSVKTENRGLAQRYTQALEMLK